MTEQGIIVQEPAPTPSEVVENATAQAKVLMDIVQRTKCFQEIKGKKYLQVEAWETIGAFNRIHAETKEVKPIVAGQYAHREGDEGSHDVVVGYEAHVQLWRDGVVVGGAIMPCYFTENACKGKQGDDKHKACMSAAQTFATSKAYRMNFSYVAILAGYQPMPAEEMSHDNNPATAIDMDWLRDSLIEMKWNDAGKWLKEHYPEAKGNTVRQMIQSLSWEHQEAFAAEVQKRLEAKG
jgi:hypothetical protein